MHTQSGRRGQRVCHHDAAASIRRPSSTAPRRRIRPRAPSRRSRRNGRDDRQPTTRVAVRRRTATTRTGGYNDEPTPRLARGRYGHGHTQRGQGGLDGAARGHRRQLRNRRLGRGSIPLHGARICGGGRGHGHTLDRRGSDQAREHGTGPRAMRRNTAAAGNQQGRTGRGDMGGAQRGRHGDGDCRGGRPTADTVAGASQKSPDRRPECQGSTRGDGSTGVRDHRGMGHGCARHPAKHGDSQGPNRQRRRGESSVRGSGATLAGGQLVRTDGHTQPWGHCHATPRSNGGDARHTQDGNGTRQPRHSSAVLGRRRQTLENDANPGRQQRYRPPTGNAPTRTGPGRARRTGDSGPHVRRLRGMADCHLTCPRGRHIRGSPHVVERGHRGTLGSPGARARAPPARQGSHTGGRHGTDHRERIRPHETRQPDRTTGSPLGNNQGENPGGSGNGGRRRRRHRGRRGSTSANYGRPQHAKGPKTPQRLRRMAGLAVRGPLPRKCWGRRAHIPRGGRRTTDDHRPLAREHGTGRQIRSRGGSRSGRARRGPGGHARAQLAPTEPRTAHCRRGGNRGGVGNTGTAGTTHG